MAWKNLKQRSLAEDMIIDHEALKELDGVDEQIDWSRIEKLLMHIHSESFARAGILFCDKAKTHAKREFMHDK